MKSIILAIIGGLVTVSTIMWIDFDSQNTPDIDARMMACNNPDSAALMALYNALAGSGWLRTGGWGQDCDVCAWAGVFCDVNDRVERLLLSNNNMIGTIPVEIGLLTELKVLQMGSNQLTGVIPDEIGALAKLEHLTLSFNALSSDLPSRLGDLLNLQFLDIGLNQLTGSLPSSLGNLSNLQFLSLSNNNMSGAIPNSITSLSELTDLAISGNALSGPIPPNIGDLTNLTTLDLSNNNLNGAIPHSMGLLSGLTSLFLNQNNLSGEIPNSIGNLSNLAFLRLDFNGLSGQLPSSLGNLTLLEYLWMNNNNLEGCYPESFSTLCGTGVWLRIQNNPCFFQGSFDGFCFNPQCFFNDFFLSAPEFVCMGDTVVLWDALGSGSTYQWSTGATTDFIEVAPTVDTWYYLEAVTSQGCRRFDSAFVQVRPNVIGIFSSTDVTTVGGSDGTATVTPTGGTGLYSYFWSTNETTQTISGLSTGTYYGTVTDINGCFASASVVIEDPVPCPVINLNLTYSNISCPGADDGFADVNPQGGQSPYSYMWSNGSISSSVFNLAPGNLQITVTDVNGCSDTSIIFNISEPAPLISTITSSDASGPGANDGTADLSVTGGTSPYTFLWSNGAISEDISGLPGSAGGTTYQVTISDDNNCQGTNQVDIFIDCLPAGTPCDDSNADTFDDQEDGNCNCAGTPCPTLILNLTSTDVSCFGANDGSASVAPQGGAAPYDFRWSTGSISSSIGNLGPGNYQVAITDANGCADSTSFSIAEPAQLTSFITPTNASAPGANDGSADLSVTGGTSPYTFLWSNGAISEEISGLPGSAGGTTYQVTVTDDNNCQGTNQVDIFIDCLPAGTTCDDSNADTFDDREDGNCNCAGTPCPTLIPNLTSTDVSCFGANDGSASVAPQGGAAPYDFRWSTGSISSSIGNLGPGSYHITITDANGCAYNSGLFPIAEPAQLTSFITRTNASVPGANDGTADLSVTGGTSPYTFLWSNGATSEDISGLAGSAGGTTYQVAITDDNNCQVTNQVDIFIDCLPAGTTCDDSNADTFDDQEDGNCNCAGTPCPTLIPNLTSTDVSCFGANDGSASVAPQGGAAPYDFRWSTGSISSSIGNLGPGNYQITITDANGCAYNSGLYPIAEPVQLTSFTTGTNASAPGANDGTADLSVTGGTSRYAFLWSNGATTEDISGLSGSAGGTTYQVTITDDNNCQVTNQVDIFIDCLPAGTTCDDSNADTFDDQEDGNCNCAGTPCPTLIPNLTSTDVSCFGANDGSASVAPQGGAAPYDFRWSTGSISSSIGNLGHGNYQVTITDANGCAYNSGLFPIAEPVQLTSFTTGTNASAPGANDGTADLSVTGGTSPYTFLWSNGATSEDISGLSGSAGGTTYQVTITDDNNCQLTDQVDIFTDCLLVGAPCDDGNINTFDDQEDGNCNCAGTPCDTQQISMQTINNNCFEEAEGAAIVFDTVERTIEWSTGDQGPIVQNLSEGSYQVTITNSDGCSSVNAFQILSPPSIELVVAVDHASTPGGSDGKIEITVVGGVKPYKVLWNTEDSTAVINNLVAGVYHVQVEDAKSCLHYDSVQVLDVPCTEYLSLLADSVSVQIDSTDSCDDLGSIHIVGVQHESALAWSIDGGQGYQVSPLFENLTSGLYELNVKHTQNGCEGTIADVRLGPDFLSPSDLTVRHPSDCGSANGSIAIDGQDGHIQISQHAEGPWFSDHIQGLRSGFITIFARSIHDSCVYTVEEDLKIGNPLEASIEAVVEHANACLSGLGKISLIPNSDDFTFSIDEGNTWYRNQQIFAVSPGNYQLLVQDSLGCIQDLDYEILVTSVEQGPTPELQIQHTSGCEKADGSFTITAPQKSIEVSFDQGETWTNDSIRSSLTVGTYQVWIREQGSGCLDSISVEIEGEISSIEVDSTLLSPTCFGSRDGFIMSGVVDSIDHHRYLWNTGDTLPQIGALSAGIYQLTITDKLNGCTKNFSFKLQEALPLDLTLPSQDSLMLCQGEAYTLELADIGYQYIWYRDDYTFSSGPDLTIVGPGVYHVMAIDSQGCEARDSLLIDYSAEVFYANFLMPSQAIMGDPIKAIEVSWPVPESIEWNVVEGAVISEDLNQATIKFAEPGTYSVFLQATNGQCMSTIEKIIEIVEDVNQIDPNTVVNPSSIRSAVAFPNPNIGNFNLLIELNDSSDLQVRIYNAQGLLVFADQTASTDIYSANIDLGPVVPGVYSVFIQTDLAWTSLNVVIE